jgi:endonuclease YncB( thermonuclease family)
MSIIKAALAAALAGAASLTLAAAPAHAADRDCSDFASQRAAQIFYIQAGGPQSDPHRLDGSDGDHRVCESNPAPYYYGTTLPNQPAPAPNGTVRVSYVVDGDTIRLANGKYVRLIGIDTPERGRPYFRAAKANLDRLVGARVRLVNPASVDDRDHYGRLLRYVRVSGGRDAGLIQIRNAMAHARYDSLDGYDRHPLQPTYRRVDANTRNLW